MRKGVLNPKLGDLDKNFDRRAFLQLGAYASIASLAPSVLASRARPNIVFILADDLGYADVGCFGAREHRTPHIDGLARTGLKLPQAYANSSICSPTRIALITGATNTGCRLDCMNPSPRIARSGFRQSTQRCPRCSSAWAIARRSSASGTWVTRLSSGRKRAGMTSSTASMRAPPTTSPGNCASRTRFATAASTTTAAKWATWGNLHFTAPHWPWEAAEDEAIARTLKDSRHRDGGDLKVYRRMVERMDRAIGQVLAALETHDVASNTIVIFTSDNGGERFSDTWPFIGQKGELLEGGVRVPLLMRWPERLRRGMQSEQVMISMDFLPTLLAAAGGEPDPAHPPDGENLLPVLIGEAPPRSRTLFWRFKAEDQAAVRDGELKYLRLSRQEGLFDVVKDPRERANLKAQRPEDFARLKSEFDAWNKTMLPYPSQGFSQSNKADGMMDRY